jgi:hypothetical protein
LRMLKSDMQKYPESVKLIQHLESRVKGQAKVLEAFLRACTAADQPKKSTAKATALQCLKWAVDPLVVVSASGKALAGGQVVDACGFHNMLMGVNQLEIIQVWFDAYEFGSPADRIRNAQRLTTTLMHEAVHWVRDSVGASDEIAPPTFRDFPEEAGHFFERLAFGKRNVCTQDQLDDAILSVRT